MRSGEARDRVEQDDDVALVLHQAFGLLDHHVGHRHVAGGGLVECGGDDLTTHRTLHLGHLLGTFVDEEDDEVDVGVVGRDGVGEILEDHRLSRAGSGDDEAALPESQRGHHVEDPCRQVVLLRLEMQSAMRVERRQVVEQRLVLKGARRVEVDRLDSNESEIAFSLSGRTDETRDRVPRAKLEPPDLRRRDVDVVGPGQVARLWRSKKSVPLGRDLEDPLGQKLTAPPSLRLEHAHDEVVLAHPLGGLDAHLPGAFGERVDGQLLELGNRRGRVGTTSYGRRMRGASVRWRCWSRSCPLRCPVHPGVMVAVSLSRARCIDKGVENCGPEVGQTRRPWWR